jgi:hypothetical protein
MRGLVVSNNGAGMLRVFTAMSGGDFEAAGGDFADDIVVDWSASLGPNAGVHHGRAVGALLGWTGARNADPAPRG